MKRLTIVLLILTVVFSVASVVDAQQKQGKAESFLKVETLGNFSYIYVGRKGDPEEHAYWILMLLQTFQQEKCLKVLSYTVEKHASCHTCSYTDGIWVTHQPSLTWTDCKTPEKK